MAQDTTQIRLAPGGHIYVAPIGSTEPTDVTTAWDAAWLELGYADDGGVDITPKINTNEIPVWQSATPGKITIQSSQFTLDFNLAQTNKDTTGFFYFGATWTTVGTVQKLVIPSAPGTDERMMGIEWTENSITNRLIVPRGMATDRQKVSINRKTGQMYGLTFEALDDAGTLAYILSNDPALV